MDRRSFLLACTVLGVVGRATAAARWPGGYVSLAYDDGLDSQLEVAVPQLEKAALRGTFYLTWDNMKDRVDQWAALPRRGHELANHTVRHPCDLRGKAVSTFAATEIDPLQRWLTKIEGPSHGRDFAYPCDVTNLGPGTPNEQARRYSRLLRQSGMLSGRTSEGGPNSVHRTLHAPYRLQALALAYDTSGLDEVEAYLEEAIRGRAWAILVFHEVGDGKRSEGFITAAEHSAVLELIQRLQIPCGTVETAIHTLSPH